jgi:hypothetical protein
VARAHGRSTIAAARTAITASAGRRVGRRDRRRELARLSGARTAPWDGQRAHPRRLWLTIEPRATAEAPWGPSDRVWHEDAPLTIFAALDYSRIAFIPRWPNRACPPAAAVLNLIAGLAADQASAVVYRGCPASSSFWRC